LLASLDPDYPEAPASEAVTVDATGLTGRRFLIVTAPFGPFGRVLAETLRARGAEVSRILLNAGDLLYWRGPGGIKFKGGAGRWPERLEELAPGYTDIVVFGEGGAYNQAVLRDVHRFDATVWVLENGYFRPDWVTVEKNGVNASSNLPRTAVAYDPPTPEIPVTRQVGKALPHHVLNISLYHLIQLPGRWLFPRYIAPYTVAPWLQCAGHIRRYFGLAFQYPNACDPKALARKGPYFIACLQREGDAQLLRYSPFADNTAFMAEVMTSFAAHAPANARLIVKNHPLDPGLVDLNRITSRLAVDRGLQDRVDFIDGGNLAQLCRASNGMVVNNSSAALSALGFHTPVKVLGQAFFDFDGLTDQKPLDAFWSKPAIPDPDLFQRFRAHVIARTQINGNYHEPRAMRPTAQAIVGVFQGRKGAIQTPARPTPAKVVRRRKR
jgi:capsular polysaccharide export protein